MCTHKYFKTKIKEIHTQMCGEKRRERRYFSSINEDAGIETQIKQGNIPETFKTFPLPQKMRFPLMYGENWFSSAHKDSRFISSQKLVMNKIYPMPA
jgi:hypothetical protein